MPGPRSLLGVVGMPGPRSPPVVVGMPGLRSLLGRVCLPGTRPRRYTLGKVHPLEGTPWYWHLVTPLKRALRILLEGFLVTEFTLTMRNTRVQLPVIVLENYKSI